MRAEVNLHIDAPPDKVWGLVSDITKMGEYSPEVIEAEWMDGATGPAVGARYRGHVKRNENWPVLYWTTCKITECVPGQVFEFAVIMGDRPVNTWRYEFGCTDDGPPVVRATELGAPGVHRPVAHDHRELEDLSRHALGDLARGPVEDGPVLV